MDVACGTQLSEQKCTEGKRGLGGPKSRYRDNTKTDIKEILEDFDLVIICEEFRGYFKTSYN